MATVLNLRSIAELLNVSGMEAVQTESLLSNWRGGHIQAERLVAALLRLEGYANIEPQSPLGGPDSRADILCDRGGFRYVVAAYFPTENQSDSKINKKFQHDLEGTQKHSRNAFAFFTNQRISRGRREELKESALKSSAECEIYDVERIRVMLDEPAGYGLRATFLGKPMRDDEQIAYFSRREILSESAIDRNTAEISRLAAQIARVEAQNRVVAQTIKSLASANGTSDEAPPLRLIDPLSVGELKSEPDTKKITWEISPELILLSHRLVCFEMPSRLIGRFRRDVVEIGIPGKAPRKVTPPDQISSQIVALCESWRDRVQRDLEKTELLAEIANFHHKFLCIHPFHDGNGRTARALLLQQCLDAFERADMSRLNRGVAYMDSLVKADSGEICPLALLIKEVVDS